MKIIKLDKYRSKPLVNMLPDRVRVTLDVSYVGWHILRSIIIRSGYFRKIVDEDGSEVTDERN